MTKNRHKNGQKRREDAKKREQKRPSAQPPQGGDTQGRLPDVVSQLRALRSRQARERAGVYYIEGARIVAQALQAGAEIELGVVAPDLLSGGHAHSTVAALRQTGAQMAELTKSQFEAISFKENLQGIGAVVRMRPESLDALRAAPPPGRRGWVALEGVGNPGNLGAIMRTCDAVGCVGLLLLGNTVDVYHPAAVRASMGSFFALRLVGAGFDEFVAWKQTSGGDYGVIGTTPDVTQAYREVRYPADYILLMGSERLGLSPRHQAVCDVLVRIPMVGTADSLNLGVATGIVLYEIFHQHQGASSA
jgi:TrmH family RNA methyltransferase